MIALFFIQEDPSTSITNSWAANRPQQKGGLMTTAGWPVLGEPPRLRRATAAVIVFMLLALVTVLGGQSTASAADANSRVNIGDCSFRKADGDAKKWANQMCWIDASDIAKPGTHNVTKHFGDYTLTYTVTV